MEQRGVWGEREPGDYAAANVTASCLYMLHTETALEQVWYVNMSYPRVHYARTAVHNKNSPHTSSRCATTVECAPIPDTYFRVQFQVNLSLQNGS